MTLDDNLETSLASYLSAKEEEQRKANKLKTQLEVFSDKLLAERLFMPAKEVFTRYESAFAHLGNSSYREDSVTCSPRTDRVLFSHTIALPLAPAEALFNTFLDVADDRAYLAPTFVGSIYTFRVGVFVLELFVSVPFPESELDFLRMLGVVRNEVSNYETISCGGL